jgi:UDP-galactopyranose mutase
MEPFDLLIVGAGPVGCTVAERAATLRGWRSIVVDKRPHLAGNCFDEKDENGILVHRYGPHYFRTHSDELYRYLSGFTEWIEGNYRVQARHQGEFFPFPINLDTLERFFGVTLSPAEAEEWLKKRRIPFPDPKNSEEWVLSRVGRELYEAFYLGYTKKQWGRHPSELAPSVCGRVPVRLTRDDRYVDAPYQVMPANGYTSLFANMLRDPRIRVLLKTDYDEVRSVFRPRVATVYCGPLDAYFGYRLGRLPWRSLRFEYRRFDAELVQPCVQINYPNDQAYTRSVEYKHVTGQRHPSTVVSYEYPMASGDPYYPVPGSEAAEKLMRYRQWAREETRDRNVHFAGRLAEYRYLNMDEAIQTGLDLFDRLSQETRPRAYAQELGSTSKTI